MNHGWQFALCWLFGVLSGCCGLIVWYAHKRRGHLRVLYRDLNDHRITPRFNAGEGDRHAN